jgi:hypothetical protein
MPGLTLLRVVGNDELSRVEREEAQREAELCKSGRTSP